jgi:hypothetical protein
MADVCSPELLHSRFNPPAPELLLARSLTGRARLLPQAFTATTGKPKTALCVFINDSSSSPKRRYEMRFLAICFCAVAMAPASLTAQQATAYAKGPTLQAAAVGFKLSDTKVDAATKVTAAPIVRRHQGQDIALMVVGVGAMIAGALIGDAPGTIIIIGGAAMALFGLYHYLE